MSESLNKFERLEALKAGTPVARPGWALWRHFYDRETTAHDLAEAMIAWQRTWDFDFLKVNPRAQYHIEPWGGRYRYPAPDRKPVVDTVPVNRPVDWDRIEPLAATVGAFGEQLEVLGTIRRRLGRDVPMVETIFTPLSVAGDLVPTDVALVEHMRTDPDRVERAVRAIAETLARFACECLNAGADGIYLATTEWARSDVVTEAEYERFGRPFDLDVLNAVADARFNVLHVCGERAFVRQLADYPVHALSWASTFASNPSIEDLARTVPKIFLCGLRSDALEGETAEVALADYRAAERAARGHPWILGANCTIRPTSKAENLRVLREAATSAA
ncbi:MAG TPA: uroporphyrinogen decarboxylase family protein [Chloroflexota bacterium]|nr:uroporphyrinogen decarboxylase family protein [Chloroflexota bacterium]